MEFAPFLICVLFLIIIAIFVYLSDKADKERANALAQVADQLGMQFYAERDPAFEQGLTDTFLGTLGRQPEAKKVLVGKYRGHDAAIFDFHYTTGSGKSQHRWTTTVVCLWFSGQPFPDFAVRPEHFGHKLGDFFGFQDIDFDHRPDFSRQFVLQGSDEARVRAEFNPNAFRFFEEHTDVYCEGRGDRLLLYRQARRAEPGEITFFLDEAIDALARFRADSNSNQDAVTRETDAYSREYDAAGQGDEQRVRIGISHTTDR